MGLDGRPWLRSLGMCESDFLGGAVPGKKSEGKQSAPFNDTCLLLCGQISSADCSEI